MGCGGFGVGSAERGDAGVGGEDGLRVGPAVEDPHDVAAGVVDQPATARWLGDRLGVPGHLMHDVDAPVLLAQAALAALDGDQNSGDTNAG